MLNLTVIVGIVIMFAELIEKIKLIKSRHIPLLNLFLGIFLSIGFYGIQYSSILKGLLLGIFSSILYYVVKFTSAKLNS